MKYYPDLRETVIESQDFLLRKGPLGGTTMIDVVEHIHDFIFRKINSKKESCGTCTNLSEKTTNLKSLKYNPFCENCKEEDCQVSFDGTCEAIRIYLETKESIEKK